jgi:hypothetical protein
MVILQEDIVSAAVKVGVGERDQLEDGASSDRITIKNSPKTLYLSVTSDVSV